MRPYATIENAPERQPGGVSANRGVGASERCLTRVRRTKKRTLTKGPRAPMRLNSPVICFAFSRIFSATAQLAGIACPIADPAARSVDAQAARSGRFSRTRVRARIVARAGLPTRGSRIRASDERMHVPIGVRGHAHHVRPARRQGRETSLRAAHHESTREMTTGPGPPDDRWTWSLASRHILGSPLPDESRAARSQRRPEHPARCRIRTAVLLTTNSRCLRRR